MVTADQLIRHLDLRPLDREGGYFRRTYLADEESAARPDRAGGRRALGTAIFFLLTSESGCFSALHRLASDEIYHFYLGDPVELSLLFPEGHSQEIVLGPDVLHGHHVQFVVPRGVWQGSRLVPGGSFALLGTTMTPGFDWRDYEDGDREQLVADYPDDTETIRRLTR